MYRYFHRDAWVGRQLSTGAVDSCRRTAVLSEICTTDMAERSARANETATTYTSGTASVERRGKAPLRFALRATVCASTAVCQR